MKTLLIILNTEITSISDFKLTDKNNYAEIHLAYHIADCMHDMLKFLYL